MKYKVIEETTSRHGFEIEVNRLIQAGWKLLGDFRR